MESATIGGFSQALGVFFSSVGQTAIVILGLGLLFAWLSRNEDYHAMAILNTRITK